MKDFKISVVTVTYNANQCVEKTIQSIVGQTYDNLEYLVIDGGSTDGTQRIVEKYAERIAVFVSEKDQGIYDGMNKGIASATGDYLLFMNAGDYFADEDVVKDVARFISSEATDADAVYGDTLNELEYGTYPVRYDAALLGTKMCVSHQAIFVRTELLRSHPFNLQYRFAADYEQLSSLFLEERSFRHIDRTIAVLEMTDGATYQHYQESADEHFTILKARGIDITSTQRSMMLRKRMVRWFKQKMPKCISYPILRYLAKHYKVL